MGNIVEQFAVSLSADLPLSDEQLRRLREERPPPSPSVLRGGRRYTPSSRCVVAEDETSKEEEGPEETVEVGRPAEEKKPEDEISLEEEGMLAEEESLERSGQVPQFEREEEPSRPPQNFEGEMGQQNTPESTEKADKCYMYHEIDLVAHTLNKMKELSTFAEKIKIIDANLELTSNDLLLAYNSTKDFLESLLPQDRMVEAALEQINENIDIISKKTSTFRSAAHSVRTSLECLEEKVNIMTEQVFGKSKKPIVIDPQEN